MPYTVHVEPQRQRAVIEMHGTVTGLEILTACRDTLDQALRRS